MEIVTSNSGIGCVKEIFKKAPKKKKGHDSVQEERDPAEASEDDDFDSPPKRKGKNKKVLRKRNSNPVAKKVVEKTGSQSNLTKNRLIMETDDDSEFETTSTKSLLNKSFQEQTKNHC